MTTGAALRPQTKGCQGHQSQETQGRASPGSLWREPCYAPILDLGPPQGERINASGHTPLVWGDIMQLPQGTEGLWLGRLRGSVLEHRTLA